MFRRDPTSWMNPYIRGKGGRPSKEEVNRKSKESEEKKFPSDKDAELVEKHGFKYLTWLLKVDFSLVKEPAKLQDWDFWKNSAFTRYSGKVHTLIGHYEIETEKDRGMTEGFTHFDLIHFPEVELVLQLGLNEDKGSDNNYGIVERTVAIPEQTLYFDNLKAGMWKDGQVNPYELNIKVDLDSKKYTWGQDKYDDIAEWASWQDLDLRDD